MSCKWYIRALVHKCNGTEHLSPSWGICNLYHIYHSGNHKTKTTNHVIIIERSYLSWSKFYKNNFKLFFCKVIIFIIHKQNFYYFTKSHDFYIMLSTCRFENITYGIFIVNFFSVLVLL